MMLKNAIKAKSADVRKGLALVKAKQDLKNYNAILGKVTERGKLLPKSKVTGGGNNKFVSGDNLSRGYHIPPAFLFQQVDSEVAALNVKIAATKVELLQVVEVEVPVGTSTEGAAPKTAAAKGKSITLGPSRKASDFF